MTEIYFNSISCKRSFFLSLMILFSTLSNAQTFNEQVGISLMGVTGGNIAWGDYDNDGDLDVLLNGTNGTYQIVTKLYKNNGNNTFSEQTGIVLEAFYYSFAAWGDYDNDGDLDILLTGMNTSSIAMSKIYKNNGNNTFSEQTSINLIGVKRGSAAWGDYDNDGDLDILLAGESSTGKTSILYRNNGNGNFDEQKGISLLGVNSSSVAWGDYDNDGDLDILLSGSSSLGKRTMLYMNNGDNTFSEQFGTILIGVNNGEVAWGDYDNDGDLDILLSGTTGSSYITKIYMNNGNNSFSLQSGISLVGVQNSSLAWGDYNNDGYLDILINGYSTSGYVSKVYKNNKNNTFTEQTNISLTGLGSGSVNWMDYDNDGDLDILISGYGGTRITKLYRNDSITSNIAPTAPTGVTAQLLGDKIRFSWNKAIDDSTYSDGLSYNIRIGDNINTYGVKSPQSNLTNGFHRIVERGLIQDTFVVIKAPASILACSKVYWSVQAIDVGFAASSFSSVDSISNGFSIEALGNDNIFPYDTIQLFVSENSCGQVSYLWSPSSSLSNPNIQSPLAFPMVNITYTVSVTEGSTTRMDSIIVTVEPFTEQTNISITGTTNGGVSWGDYDNDGNIDIIVFGYKAGGAITKVYRNMGNNVFIEQLGIVLPGVYYGSVDWGDYDNDGDLDILLAGTTTGSAGSAITKIFKNNGNHTFSEQTAINLVGVYYGIADWGDFDNDGDLDIFLCGRGTPQQINTKVYENNGNNTFTIKNNTGLPLWGGTISAWSDYDNDGDLDVILNGYNVSFQRSTKIFKNNGNFNFTELINPIFSYLDNVDDIAWGDYDSDGDLDIICIGKNASYQNITKIFRNDGSDVFSMQSTSLLGASYGGVAWGDHDNDGDLDILLSGTNTSISDISQIYTNNGNNNFTDLSEASLTVLSHSSLAWGDYDNDGDLDALLSGYQGSGLYATKIYKNNTQRANLPPSIPINTAVQTSDSVQFSWSKSYDNNTPTNSLTYNISIGSQVNRNGIKSSNSNLTNGFRKLVKMGNTQLDTNYRISTFDFYAGDTLYWKVQSLDNSFEGSAFSQEDTTIIPFYINVERTDTVSICPQSFSLNINDNFDTIGGGSLSYAWSPGIGLSDSTIKNPIASFIGNTLYTVIVSSSSSYVGTDTFRVQLYPIPISTYSIISSTEVDSVVSLNYTGLSSSMANYNWSFDSATVVSGSGQGPFQLLWPSVGNKQLSLIVSENGCSSTTTIDSIIVTPTASFSLDSNVCSFDTTYITYTGSASSNAVYSWNFNGATVLSGSGQGPYNVYWGLAGAKTISLAVIENGISSIQNNDSIMVSPLPSVSISQNNIVCLNNSILLTSSINSGLTPITYLWSSYDTTNSTQVSPIVDSMFYLNITDANGCQNMDSTLVLVKEPYTNEEICLVTVDSATVKNIVVWEKTPNVGTDFFKIFKESTVVNVYDSIGFRPYDSLGVFIDNLSQPLVKSGKYRIAVVDSCGNESVMSPHHKTMHLTINKGLGWTFNLIWSPYEGFQVQTYRIWRYKQGTGWSKIDSVSGGTTFYTDNPPQGLIHYFVEIIPPYPCNITKANTNYNSVRSNRANNGIYMGMEYFVHDWKLQVYPNPYTKTTNITYQLNHTANVEIEVYSTLGKLVKVIVNEEQVAGSYIYQFKAQDYGFSAGVYLLRVKVDNELLNRKLIEVK